MPHVLSMPALELGNPMAFVVGGEASDTAFHEPLASGLSVLLLSIRMLLPKARG
jgi:hypothetical protein